MTKKKKIILISISSFLVASIAVLTALYFHWDYIPKGHHVEDPFDKNQTFSNKYISTVEKDPNKEFVILNFADVQLSDFEKCGTEKNLQNEMKELIQRTHPDLITLTGDQVWTRHNKNALKREISWMEGFQIPWAPVFGNHDCEGTAKFDYTCDLYEDAKYCLFKRGPSNLGSLGNYVVNITENGNVYRTLYMVNFAEIDEFSSQQLDFLKWNADGIKGNQTNYVEGMSFFHKGISAYNRAYQYHLDEALTEVHCDPYEIIARVHTGEAFFELAKSINIKHLICGHEHGHYGTIPVDGVNCTFALKTGDLVLLGEQELDPNIFYNGATSITLDSDQTIYHLNMVDKKYRIH